MASVYWSRSRALFPRGDPLNTYFGLLEASSEAIHIKGVSELHHPRRASTMDIVDG